MAKKTSKFKQLWANTDPKNYTEIFLFNDKKFRIRFEHTNGTPCGFNYKCSLAIMGSEGTFHNLVDNFDVGVKWANEYVGYPATCKTENDRVIPAFYKYVESVYGE